MGKREGSLEDLVRIVLGYEMIKWTVEGRWERI